MTKSTLPITYNILLDRARTVRLGILTRAFTFFFFNYYYFFVI